MRLSEIPIKPSPPEWVTSDSNLSQGLDLLGLRLVSQAIGTKYLNGITSITPSARYLALRAWIIHKYVTMKLPDVYSRFIDFAGKIECTIATANMLVDRRKGGIIGSIGATHLIDDPQDPIPMSRLVSQLATLNYSQPSFDLGISFSEGRNVPGLSKERGLPLAREVDTKLRDTALPAKLENIKNLSFSRKELLEIGRAYEIDNIDNTERDLLVSILIPETPRAKDWNRIGTYCYLLKVAKNTRSIPNDDSFFRDIMAVKSVRGLESAMDGWTMYLTRDMITVVHEGALAVIVGKLRQEKKSYITSQLITELISSSDLDFPLKELSLLRKNESLSDIRFNQLYERIESKINSKKSLVRGLYRWEESINENDIIDLAFSCTDSSVLSLLPVAWIITELRCRDTLRSSDDKFDFLSYKGFARFGLKDIMIPLLDNWHKNNPPLLDIIYELTLRTISQHLRIVLTRMSVDFKRDTAVLNADGEYLHFRKEFLLRRTISRLRQLSSWLVQLGLINNDGITAYGNRILNRTLTTLAEKGIKE